MTTPYSRQEILKYGKENGYSDSLIGMCAGWGIGYEHAGTGHGRGCRCGRLDADHAFLWLSGHFPGSDQEHNKGRRGFR